MGAGVTLLTEPHVHPLIRCNIFHVRGRSTDLIVDTGVGVASVRDELADLLDRPVVAVATHIHYDHVGGLHEFENRVMHHVEAPRMASYREMAALRRSDFDAQDLDFLASIGYPISADLLIDALPNDGFDPGRYGIVSTTVTREVDEGDRIDLGDRSFEVLHLPGHSPGNIGLFEATTGVLFTGDAIYDGPLIDGLPDSDVEAYLHTMERLRRTPARIVHGGHDQSFGRDRLIELIDAYIETRT
jgi:glyoxylase-like metal-dependent hydrolase (beta-lactamase superfamily II)